MADEAKRAAIVEELRGWWPLLVGDQPAPAPPRPTVQPSEPTAAFAAPSVLATSPLGEPAPTQNSSPPTTEGPGAPDPDAAGADAPSGREPEEPLPAATAAPTTSDVPAPSHVADLEAPAELSIEFEHHLSRGNLQVWVDDALVVDEDFDSRVTHKVLAFEMRKGSVHELMPLSPGRHDVRVQVRWDGNVKSARTSGTFPPGATRRVKVQVGRLRGNVSLAWK